MNQPQLKLILDGGGVFYPEMFIYVLICGKELGEASNVYLRRREIRLHLTPLARWYARQMR